MKDSPNPRCTLRMVILIIFLSPHCVPLVRFSHPPHLLKSFLPTLRLLRSFDSSGLALHPVVYSPPFTVCSLSIPFTSYPTVPSRGCLFDSSSCLLPAMLPVCLLSSYPLIHLSQAIHLFTQDTPLTPGMDKTRLFIRLSAGAGTICMTPSSPSPILRLVPWRC